MRAVPMGWVEATLEDLCEFNPKHDPETDRATTVSFIPMPAVDDETGAIVDRSAIRPLSEVWKGYTHFADADVIFAKITPCMENGKIAVARDLENGMACGSTEFHVLRSKGAVEPDFVWRFLRQQSYRQVAERSMTGAVGQRRVPKPFLEGTVLPLPPLAEQKRIVTKLDALNAKSARARTELARIETLVSRYKQAVLTKAFSGELTRGQVSNWSSCILGDLALDVRYGTAEKCTYTPELTPVLRIPNVANGRIDLSDLKHASFNEKELMKLALVEGDLLVIRSNGSLDLVGRSAVVDSAAAGMLFAGYLIRIRLDLTKALPPFIQYWMQSLAVRRTIEDAAKSTSGVNNVNSQQLQALQLQLPALEEQQEIVRRIGSAFAKIDRLAGEAKRALELVVRLDEAILAKAFRGELVTQDDNDEPAEKMLERIRSERQATPRAGRSKV
ncbi:type I restriction endonuclease subunit S [Sinorhizobium medicae]|nr:type I restriction endonuclease subunit S [Sinorhizobium medicae]